MFKPFLTGAVIALSAFALSPGTAMAGEQPNILIMGEDADQDTIPRNSRIFNRVLRAMESEMQAMGFRVYDETAVTMGITDPGRVRRTDAEVITVARRVQDVPIDVATVFQIYASAEQNPFADITDLRVRVSGRLLNVPTGQALANYEVSYGPGDLPPLPPQCNRECQLENVGDHAGRIGADVARALAVHLDFLSPTAPATGAVITGTAPAPDGCVGMTTAYTIILRNFSADQVTQVEEYLVSFSGYDHHRPMRASGTEATYWYETCSDQARLNRNLRLMTEHMGMTVEMRMVGNRFEIDSLRRPAQR